MKKSMNISLLFLFFLCLSIYGKQHKIFLENFTIESVKAPKEIIVIIDDSPKLIKVKSGKKAVTFVKGKNHKIEINYTYENEKKVRIAEFSTPLNKIITLELGSLVGEKEKWIREEVPVADEVDKQ